MAAPPATAAELPEVDVIVSVTEAGRCIMDAVCADHRQSRIITMTTAI